DWEAGQNRATLRKYLGDSALMAGDRVRSPSGPFSRGSWVRFVAPVVKDLEEIEEIVLLLRTELEIADLAVRLRRGSRLGWRHSRNVLHVLEDLGWREECSEAGRRTLAEVKSNLLAACVHGDVPLVVEVDDILE